MTLFWAIISLWIAVYAIERIAELLQYKAASLPYPESLSEIQNPAEHEKALAYLGERNRLGWTQETIGLIAFIVICGSVRCAGSLMTRTAANGNPLYSE